MHRMRIQVWGKRTLSTKEYLSFARLARKPYKKIQSESAAKWLHAHSSLRKENVTFVLFGYPSSVFVKFG